MRRNAARLIAAAALAQPFSASLTKKVRKALAGVRRVPLLVRITVAVPGGTPATVFEKVTLRL